MTAEDRNRVADHDAYPTTTGRALLEDNLVWANATSMFGTHRARVLGRAPCHGVWAAHVRLLLFARES